MPFDKFANTIADGAGRQSKQQSPEMVAAAAAHKSFRQRKTTIEIPNRQLAPIGHRPPSTCRFAFPRLRQPPQSQSHKTISFRSGAWLAIFNFEIRLGGRTAAPLDLVIDVFLSLNFRCGRGTRKIAQNVACWRN